MDGQQAGSGEMHLGWHGGMLCLGAGPVRVRWSEADAAELHIRLGSLLEDGPGSELCGCETGDPAQQVPRVAQGKQDGPGDDQTASDVLADLRRAQRGFRGL